MGMRSQGFQPLFKPIPHGHQLKSQHYQKLSHSPLLSRWIPTLAKALFHHLLACLASGHLPLSLLICPQATLLLIALIHLRFTPSKSPRGHLSHLGWTIFGLTCVASWLFHFLAIRDLGSSRGHSYLLFGRLGIARPSTAPELGPSSFHSLFEHSLQPELVQNEWNATVIGGKGSSLWRGARI